MAPQLVIAVKIQVPEADAEKFREAHRQDVVAGTTPHLDFFDDLADGFGEVFQEMLGFRPIVEASEAGS